MLARNTVNRLLLRGAERHHRQALFATAGGSSDPDWRCDRLSLRIALALREVFSLGPGDVAALWMPLSVEWALLERALWGLGSVSLALPSDRGFAEISEALSDRPPKLLFTSGRTPVPPFSIPVVTLEAEERGDGSLADLQERGGILDTPERAAEFRATARNLPPSAPASVEALESVALTQGEWAERIEDHLRLHPALPGARRELSGRGSALSARVELYSGWADGTTTLVFDKGGARG